MTSLQTYAEVVYQQLREEILSGALMPGDRLTEQGLAERMGTSHGPVREALARLGAQGLVLGLPHRGSFVTEISAEDARDVYQVRVVLERRAMALAVAAMTDADYVELRKAVDNMVHAADAGTFHEHLARDMAFHRRVFELAGSPLLLLFWETIEAKTRKFALIASPRAFEDAPAIAKTHYQLLGTMQSGDAAALDQEVEQHIMRIWEVLEEEQDPSQAPAGLSDSDRDAAA
jgi:DNA-binding GntR family transcriptional regulator